MSRIPLVAPEDLPPEAAETYKRGKLDLTRLLAHGKTVYPAYRMLTQAVFAQLTIPPRERELIVLAVLHLDRGEYQWAQHVQVALDNGIPQEKIDAIANDRFNAPVLNEREKALLSFTRQVMKTVRVDDAVFNAVAAFYDPQQIVETIYTIGHYMLLLRFSEVCELPLDGVNGAALVRLAVAEEAEKSRAAQAN